MVQPSEKLLTLLAAKINYVGQIAAWKNPFKALQRENPNLFREGSPDWSDNTEWSSDLNKVFLYLHGNLMSKLCYMSEANISDAQKLMTPEMKDLINITQRLLVENKGYRTICDERSAVIKELKRVCDHRLSLIEDLSKRLMSERQTS